MTMGSFSVEMCAFPCRSAVASMTTTTTVLAKCFIPMDSVKNNASASKVER